MRPTTRVGAPLTAEPGAKITPLTYHLAGGLVFLMAALIVMMSCASATVVVTIRREAAEREAQGAAEGRELANDLEPPVGR